MTAQARIPLRDLPEWPAALDAPEALAYSRLSESELRRRVRDGELVFKPVGPNGRKVCLREQLDEVLRRIWSEQSGSTPPTEEDLDFGDG